MKDLEIILVDNENGSKFVQNIQAKHPHTQLLISDNLGYAGGNNLGLSKASGEWIMVLNPDTVVHPSTIDQLYHLSQQYPKALISPKLLLPNGNVNACGNHMHITGLVSCAALGEPSSRHLGVKPIMLLSGAAIFAPRSIWQTLGGFESFYFMYHEDSNLSLRAHLAGYKLLCAADTAVVHDYSFGLNPVKLFYLERNRLLTVLITYSKKSLLLLSLAFIITELALWIYCVLKGLAYLRAKRQTYQWIVEHRDVWLKRRKDLQGNRVIKQDYWLQSAHLGFSFEQLIPSQPLAWLLKRLSFLVFLPWRWLL